jgi:hypothetical protein
MAHQKRLVSSMSASHCELANADHWSLGIRYYHTYDTINVWWVQFSSVVFATLLSALSCVGSSVSLTCLVHCKLPHTRCNNYWVPSPICHLVHMSDAHLHHWCTQIFSPLFNTTSIRSNTRCTTRRIWCSLESNILFPLCFYWDSFLLYIGFLRDFNRSSMSLIMSCF